MRILAAVAAAVLFSAAPLPAGGFDDGCRHTAPRRAVNPVAGVKRVVIHAEAGSLTVTGTPGVTQIVASGTACTSDRDFLDEMTLTMHQQGSDLHVDAKIPEKTVFFGFFSASLDFSVTVPAGLPVVIDDDSGWIKLSGTGPASIQDESGSIEARSVAGTLTIVDDSGSIDVSDVRGNVSIEDDSGDITVSQVQGMVEIEDDSGGIVITDVAAVRIREDDSGSIEISKVKGNVEIGSDGSGSVDVSDVGGSFTLGEKTSGSIDYARVAGKVSVPKE